MLYFIVYTHTLTHAVPDEPTNFVATAVNSTTISLSWDEPIDPNGRVLSYHLTARIGPQDIYAVPSGLAGLNTTLGDGDLRTTELYGLHPYVLYLFQLSAATSVGQGNLTATRMVTTQQAGTYVYLPTYVYSQERTTSDKLLLRHCLLGTGSQQYYNTQRTFI